MKVYFPDSIFHLTPCLNILWGEEGQLTLMVGFLSWTILLVFEKRKERI